MLLVKSHKNLSNLFLIKYQTNKPKWFGEEIIKIKRKWMRENLTSVFERQGKDFATRAYPSLFKFLFLDELLCEKNAFAEMQKNFVALPPSSPVPDPTPTRKRKRKAEPIVAAALSTRKLRSSTSPTNFLDLESIEPSKRKKGSPSAKVGPGIANLGMTCYVASALQVAVSVSSWKEVMLIFQKND